jgi:hypothetical protein
MRGHWRDKVYSLGEFVLVDKPYGMDYYGDIMEGDSYEICDLNGYYLFTLDSDEFEKYFISLEDLREEKINEILK